MAKPSSGKAKPSTGDNVASVADSILKEFFAELAKEKDLKEISERLEVVVLGQRSFSEPSIRSALFEAEEP